MLPRRKKQPHDVPSWVSDDSRYFITINCRVRGEDALCGPGKARGLVESIAVYESMGKWYVFAMVIMPDHVHRIASFARDPGLRRAVQSWKGFHAKNAGIAWQSGFFEHRLRNEHEFTEKVSYVLMNPVRAGLTAQWQAWSHRFVRGEMRHAPPHRADAAPAYRPRRCRAYVQDRKMV